jgi:hypothetical protein
VSRFDLFESLRENPNVTAGCPTHPRLLQDEWVRQIVTEPESGDPSVVMKVIKQHFPESSEENRAYMWGAVRVTFQKWPIEIEKRPIRTFG